MAGRISSLHLFFFVFFGILSHLLLATMEGNLGGFLSTVCIWHLVFGPRLFLRLYMAEFGHQGLVILLLE